MTDARNCILTSNIFFKNCFQINLFMKPNCTYIGNQTKNFVFNILIKKVPFSYLDNLFKDEYSIDDFGHQQKAHLT